MLTFFIATVVVSLVAPFFYWDYVSFVQRRDDHEIEDSHVAYRRDTYGTQHEYRRVAGGWVEVAAYKVL